MAENEKNTVSTVEETKEETKDEAVKENATENNDSKKDLSKKLGIDEDGLTQQGRENEALEAALEEEMNEEDAGDLIIDDTRESIPLTVENVSFKKNAAGLVSMTLKHADGKIEEFERIVPVRCFPITSPNEFISIREPDTAQQTRGHEIGIIRYITDIDEEGQALVNKELDTRYFLPEILKVNSVKEKFGYYYWDVVTSAGDIVFVLNNPFYNIRSLEDKSLFISDTEGNCFKISDLNKLDNASLRKIEIYL